MRLSEVAAVLDALEAVGVRHWVVGGWGVAALVGHRTHAVQQGPAGTTYEYPATWFTSGSLNGRPVACLTAARQLEAHQGYEPREQDRHDLALLAALASIG